MTSVANFSRPGAESHNEGSSSSEGDWILVEDGILKGVSLVVNHTTGEVVSLSTKNCREEDRWEDRVPAHALRNYPVLETLDLDKSYYLTDFDVPACYMPRLQRLFLTRCSRLTTISPSISGFQSLTELSFFDSNMIGSLPEEIGALKSLKKLTFGASSGVANKELTKLPESVGQLVHLEELVLDQCKTLAELPESIGNLKRLTMLHMRSCKRLTVLPSSIGGCISLRDVSLAKCSSLQSLPDSIENWTELEELVLTKCTSLENLPAQLSNCKKLAHLNLRSCATLETLPEGLENLPRLRTLDLALCDKLAMVPTWLIGDVWRMGPLDFSYRVKKRKSSKGTSDKDEYCE